MAKSRSCRLSTKKHNNIILWTHRDGLNVFLYRPSPLETTLILVDYRHKRDGNQILRIIPNLLHQIAKNNKTSAYNNIVLCTTIIIIVCTSVRVRYLHYCHIVKHVTSARRQQRFPIRRFAEKHSNVAHMQIYTMCRGRGVCVKKKIIVQMRLHTYKRKLSAQT